MVLMVFLCFLPSPPFTSAFYDVSFPSQRKKSNVVCISLRRWECHGIVELRLNNSRSNHNEFWKPDVIETSFGIIFFGTVIQIITSTFIQIDYKKNRGSFPSLGKKTPLNLNKMINTKGNSTSK